MRTFLIEPYDAANRVRAAADRERSGLSKE